MTGDIPTKPVWIMEENIFTKIVYRFTLKFTRVGIVEMLEIFSDCIWEGYSYEKNKLAFVDGTKKRRAIILLLLILIKSDKP
jgi:hypothetical protein